MNRGYYVTGTDTAVGKTLVSVALLHALRARGHSAVGMKPVASGCEQTIDGLRNDDAIELQAASAPTPAYALVNPFALPAATAPQIAAQAAGIEVTLAPILAAYRTLANTADAMVVEGVGGWLAPLADGLEQARLAAALQLPVLLVVGMKLGCLNHARLTERAILGDGLPLAGWVGNAIDPGLQFADQYTALLGGALQSPCLGLLPHARDRVPATFATYLHLPPFG